VASSGGSRLRRLIAKHGEAREVHEDQSFWIFAIFVGFAAFVIAPKAP